MRFENARSARVASDRLLQLKYQLHAEVLPLCPAMVLRPTTCLLHLAMRRKSLTKGRFHRIGALVTDHPGPCAGTHFLRHSFSGQTLRRGAANAAAAMVTRSARRARTSLIGCECGAPRGIHHCKRRSGEDGSFRQGRARRAGLRFCVFRHRSCLGKKSTGFTEIIVVWHRKAPPIP